MNKALRTMLAILGGLVMPWLAVSLWNRPGVNFWGDALTMAVVLVTSVGSGVAFLTLLPIRRRERVLVAVVYSVVTVCAIWIVGLVLSFI